MRAASRTEVISLHDTRCLFVSVSGVSAWRTRHCRAAPYERPLVIAWGIDKRGISGQPIKTQPGAVPELTHDCTSSCSTTRSLKGRPMHSAGLMPNMSCGCACSQGTL